MRISHCIQELNHLILEDGNLEVDKVAIDKDKLCVLIDDVWYDFEQYDTNEKLYIIDELAIHKYNRIKKDSME